MAYHVKNTSGSTITVTNQNGSNASTYDPSGDNVIFVSNAVSTTITVKSLTTGLIIEGARVIIKVSSGVNFPYQDVVTITRSVNTATVTHTSHGLSTGNKVFIGGAEQNEYNGVKSITVVDANSYTYGCINSPTTPATGTITSTMVIIDGITNSVGVISDSRSFANNQLITGKVRMASSEPFYKTSYIDNIINNSTGAIISIQMVLD